MFSYSPAAMASVQTASFLPAESVVISRSKQVSSARTSVPIKLGFGHKSSRIAEVRCTTCYSGGYAHKRLTRSSFISAWRNYGWFGGSQSGLFSYRASDVPSEVSSHADEPQADSELKSPLETSPLKGDHDLQLDNECQGRCGTVSFYVSKEHTVDLEGTRKIDTSNWWCIALWVLGPGVLISSVVLPPFFLRNIFEAMLGDSLVTDLLILFFTEFLFYMGVSVFLLVAHKVQLSTGVLTWKTGSFPSLGYRLSSIITMILAILLPIGAFGMAAPWTGPAAVAALFPYMASLVVQYAFEQIVQEKRSSVWPLIPIVFQVYRLHQLNRATQLVAGLLYSIRGAEATTETLAVNGSLQTLLSVLELLGMLCLWSLGSFLTHIFTFHSVDAEPKLSTTS